MDDYQILSSEVRRKIIALLPMRRSQLYRQLRGQVYYTVVHYHLEVLIKHGYVTEEDDMLKLTSKGARLRDLL